MQTVQQLTEQFVLPLEAPEIAGYKLHVNIGTDIWREDDQVIVIIDHEHNLCRLERRRIIINPNR